MLQSLLSLPSLGQNQVELLGSLLQNQAMGKQEGECNVRMIDQWEYMEFS